MSGQTTERRPSGPGAALAESTSRTPFALSWSGGKDSALTLWTLRRQGREPEALITTVTEGYERIIAKRAKFHVPISRGPLDALPLRWIYVLETQDGPQLELCAASGVDAFALLHEHTYRRELLADRAAMSQHLQQCAGIAGRARVVRVIRPALTMTAEATADAILADIDAHRLSGTDHLEEALLP